MIPKSYLNSSESKKAGCCDSEAIAMYSKSKDVKKIIKYIAPIWIGGALLTDWAINGPILYKVGYQMETCAIKKNNFTGERILERDFTAQPFGIYFRIPFVEKVAIAKDILNQDDLRVELMKATILFKNTKEYHTPIKDEQVYGEVYKQVYEAAMKEFNNPEVADRIAHNYATLESYLAGVKNEAKEIYPYICKHLHRYFGKINTPEIKLFDSFSSAYSSEENTIYVSWIYSGLTEFSKDPYIRTSLVHELMHAQGIIPTGIIPDDISYETYTQITTLEILAEIAKVKDPYKPALFEAWSNLLYGTLLSNYGYKSPTPMEQVSLDVMKKYNTDTYVQIKMAFLDNDKIYVPWLKETWELNDLYDMLKDLYPTNEYKLELSIIPPEKIKK